MSTILATETVKIADLNTHPQNARRGNLELIKESLLTNGQYRTIVANRRNSFIIAGNHTFMAARDLGWETVEVNWVEADEAAEQKILLVDNRANDASGYDEAALGEMLEQMMLAGQLKGTGYNPDDVDDLLSKLDALPVTAEAEVTAQHAESPEETAARYRAPDAVVEMRQFVLMYPADTVGAEVETNLRVLKAAWGIDSVKDIFAEALRRGISAEV